MKKVLTIFMAIVLLTGSNLLDKTFQRFEKFQLAQAPTIPFGSEIPVYIVLSFRPLVLAYYVLYINHRSFLIAFLYILLGAFMLFSMLIPGVFFWGSIISDVSIYSWISGSAASIFAFTRNSAAMILIIGCIRLLPNKSLWHREA